MKIFKDERERKEEKVQYLLILHATRVKTPSLVSVKFKSHGFIASNFHQHVVLQTPQLLVKRFQNVRD